MKAGEPGWGGHPDPPSCGAASGHPMLLLALLGLLSIPVARGDCGPPPAMSHSRPSGDEHRGSFPVGARVTYTCVEGARKIPRLPDTMECLPGNLWSKLPEPCGPWYGTRINPPRAFQKRSHDPEVVLARSWWAQLFQAGFPRLPGSCAAPIRLRFAALSEEDERKNFFAVGANVSYVCRPGYENTSESSPSSTCLENLTWSEPAELCRRRSCGAPGALPGGRTVPVTDLRFGARVKVFCDEGYKLVGRDFIWCQLKGTDVEWSKLPTCELITCSPPPQISNGKHDGEGIETFAYNSTVTYSCDSNFQLVGNGSIRCTSRDKASGVWSGAAPECKEKRSAVRLGAKDVEGTVPPTSPQGSGTRPSQKALRWQMKLSLYKKALQNTISSSQSSSFFRKPVSRSWPTSAFRFVLPLYISQKYYSGTSKGSMCPPKYVGISGILPQSGCFPKLKWSKVASFCGRRSWAARGSWTRRKCCCSTFPTRCKGSFYP